MRARGQNQGGQAIPLLLLLLAVLAGAAVLIARLGAAANDRARARTAADAAALAGVIEGEEAAQQIARANGATLERFELEGNYATVEVRLGEARAAASAERLDGGAPVGDTPVP